MFQFLKCCSNANMNSHLYLDHEMLSLNLTRLLNISWLLFPVFLNVFTSVIKLFTVPESQAFVDYKNTKWRYFPEIEKTPLVYLFPEQREALSKEGFLTNSDFSCDLHCTSSCTARSDHAFRSDLIMHTVFLQFHPPLQYFAFEKYVAIWIFSILTGETSRINLWNNFHLRHNIKSAVKKEQLH